MYTSEYYLHLCELISTEVRAALIMRLKREGFNGDTNSPKSMKSTHTIDRIANRIIMKILKRKSCNIFLEGVNPVIKRNAHFSIFIDPIDGSLNYDRGVGDPCLVVAVSEKTQGTTFSDLSFAYVEGLRSGDKYYFKENNVCFYSGFAKQEFVIKHRRKNISLSAATIYLRLGYGGVGKQLRKGLPVLLECKDARSVDNTGIELCEIARGAAHLMIEGREGSDHFNLLAYPIVRRLGGLITDLKGRDIGNIAISPTAKLDFIACANLPLLDEIFTIMEGYKKSKASSTIKPSLI